MRLSSSTGQAVKIVLLLTKSPKGISKDQLLQDTCIPADKADYTLSELEKNGLIKHNQQNLYSMKMSPYILSLYDIVQIMDGGINVDICKKDNCEYTDMYECPTYRACHGLQDIIDRYLKTVIIAELAGMKNNRK